MSFLFANRISIDTCLNNEIHRSKVKFKENVSISIESKNLIWPLRKKGKIDIVLHEIFTITSP